MKPSPRPTVDFLTPDREAGAVDAGTPPVLADAREPVQILLNHFGDKYQFQVKGKLRNGPGPEDVPDLFPTGELDVFFMIERSHDFDLEAESRGLISTFHKMLMNTRYGEWISKDTELNKTPDDLVPHMLSFLGEFARRGNYIFEGLFSVERMRKPVEHRKRIQQALLSLLRRARLISVVSNEPLFPWGFVFEGKFEASLRRPWEPFWGFQHEIQVKLPESPTELILPDPPDIAAAICPKVDKPGWHRAPDHPLRERLPPDAPLEQVGQLRTALEAEEGFAPNCLYFFGHAGSQEENDPWLELDEDKLFLRTIRVKGSPSLKFQRIPVVIFFNGCSTAPVIHFDNGSPLGYFFRHGDYRLCCLGSVGSVPGPFAAEFARRFWQSFLKGVRLGTALLDVRMNMMEDFLNPLSLLYALYGEADTRVRRG